MVNVPFKMMTALAVTICFSCGPAFAGTYRVIAVHEGDLLEATGIGGTRSVRLAAIDAPEMSTVKNRPGQPFCERARLHLSDLVLEKTVSIETYAQDGHGRTIGVVYLAGVNVNLQMIEAGLAEVYRGKSPEKLDLTPYRDAERRARNALRGIWVLRDQYFSPKDWREIYSRDRDNG